MQPLDAGWGVVCLTVGGAITAAFNYFGGGRTQYKDQLQMALRRVDSLEKRLDAQAQDIGNLRAQLAQSEAHKSQLEQELADLQAEVAGYAEHVEALTRQVRELGAQPAPPPRTADGRFSPQKNPRKRGTKNEIPR